jgi:hypothetical protein
MTINALITVQRIARKHFNLTLVYDSTHCNYHMMRGDGPSRYTIALNCSLSSPMRGHYPWLLEDHGTSSLYTSLSFSPHLSLLSGTNRCDASA